MHIFNIIIATNTKWQAKNKKTFYKKYELLITILLIILSLIFIIYLIYKWYNPQPISIQQKVSKDLNNIFVDQVKNADIEPIVAIGE